MEAQIRQTTLYARHLETDFRRWAGRGSGWFHPCRLGPWSVQWAGLRGGWQERMRRVPDLAHVFLLHFQELSARGPLWCAGRCCVALGPRCARAGRRVRGKVMITKWFDPGLGSMCNRWLAPSADSIAAPWGSPGWCFWSTHGTCYGQAHRREGFKSRRATRLGARWHSKTTHRSGSPKPR